MQQLPILPEPLGLSEFSTSEMFLEICDVVTCITLQKESQSNRDENLTLVCFVRKIFSEIEVRKQVFFQPIFPHLR